MWDKPGWDGRSRETTLFQREKATFEAGTARSLSIILRSWASAAVGVLFHAQTTQDGPERRQRVEVANYNQGI